MVYSEMLARVMTGGELKPDVVNQAIEDILSGKWDQVQVAGFLVAMRQKRETEDEVVAAVKAIRGYCVPVEATEPELLVDTCGTGGDGSRTFNISTAAAFVIAACGARVAKHGNRAQSGVCGSADLLAALGADLAIEPSKISKCLTQIGICFMFAPAHYPVLKTVASVRKSLGVRTMFNMLGPLLNPASAGRQVIGVFDLDLIERYCIILKRLGCKKAVVVHAEGLDEFSVCTRSDYAILNSDGNIELASIEPEDLGMKKASLADLQVVDLADSLAMFNTVVDNQAGPAKDAVVLNAAAGLVVADLANDIQEGIILATEAISNGKLRDKVEQFRAFYAN